MMKVKTNGFMFLITRALPASKARLKIFVEGRHMKITVSGHLPEKNM